MKTKTSTLLAMTFALLFAASSLALLVKNEPEPGQAVFFGGAQSSITRTAWVVEPGDYSKTASYVSFTFNDRNPNVYTPREASAPAKFRPGDILRETAKGIGDGVAWFFSFDWLFTRAAAATFTASQTGPWDIDSTWGGAGLACVYNVTCPGTGDQADINGFTVTVRTSVSIFKVNANAANSIFIIDPTINAANITFTFDDTASAGFSCSGGLGGLRISTAGTATYSVTINSAAAPPTNFWGVQTSVTCWQFSATRNLNYTTLTDSDQPSIICAGDEICTHTALTLKRSVGGSPTTPNFQAIGNAMTRLINPVFDNSNCCGTIATPRVLFLDGPLAINGGSLTAGNVASAAPGLLAYRDFAGAVNDYRFVFGNTFDDGASGLGPQDLAVGDRPDSNDDVTWGSALSAEKGKITISQTWNTLTMGGSTMLRLSGSIAFVIDSGGYTQAGSNTLIGSSATITVNGSWSTSAGTFTIGTSAVILNAAGTLAVQTTSSFYNLSLTGGTITVSTNMDVDNDLTISGATAVYAKGTTNLVVDGALTLSGGTMTSTSGGVTVAGAVNVSSVDSGIDFGSEIWVVGGEWTNESTDASKWDRGSGTMNFESSTGGVMVFAGANLAEDEFWNVTFASSNAATQTFTMETRGLRLGGALVIDSTTILAKETYTLTVGGTFTLEGGEANALTSISGAASITGAVSIGASAYIDFGSETWTIAGTWTNSTTSASWDAGTGTVIFTSATGGTMTFAGINLSEAEFYNIRFFSSSATLQTFTMSTRGLRWSGDATEGLRLGSKSGLNTSNLSLTGGTLWMNITGNPGEENVLTTNASTVNIFNFYWFISGGADVLTLTSGQWTLTGDWDSTSSGAGTMTMGTSAVTMTGADKTIAITSGDGFYNLTVTADTYLLTVLDVDAALVVSSASGFLNVDGFTVSAGSVTLSSSGTFVSDTGAIILSGNWDSSGGTFLHGTSTMYFIASASLTVVGNSITEGPYNLTIYPGQTLTISVNNTWISNVLTVNGTLVGSTPQTVIFASGISGSNMLVLGGSADVDDSGYLILRGRGPCGTTYTIPSALYEHLGVQGGNSACAYTFNLGGNISTPSCGIYNQCAILLSSEATATPAAFFTFNTMNYDVFAGGTLWLGDGSTTGGTFNFGTSTIEAYGINPAGSNIVVNLQTSSVIAHPSSELMPIAFYTTFNSVVYGNAAIVTIHGAFRLGYGLDVVSGIVAGSSTWYVLNDEGSPGYGSPGDVLIVSDNAYIQFGTSTWFVEREWTNNSTNSALWDAGTGTVTLSAAANVGHYFGCTRLVEDEFYNLILTSSSATPVTVTLYDDFYDPEGYGCLNVAGTLTVSDSVSTVTVVTNNLPVSAGTFSIATGGILAAGTSNLNFSTLNVLGGTLTMDGQTITNFSLSISSGTVTITVFTLFTTGSSGKVYATWTQTASVSGGTLTVSVVSPGRRYLFRDGSLLGAGQIGATFTFTGGWGTDDVMTIEDAHGEPVLTTAWNWGIIAIFFGACFLGVFLVWGWRRR